MIGKLFRASLVALVVLIGVIAFNTWRYAPSDQPILDAALPSVDADALAQSLSQAVTFETISYLPPRPSPAFGAFLTWLEAEFPVAHAAMTQERINTLTPLYRWAGADPSLRPVLLAAHYDVVPIAPGSDDKWDHPPFSGTIADGFIYGRGTLDDKGAIVAMLGAVEALLADGFTPPRDIYFSFGHDEEIGGVKGAYGVVKHLREKGIRMEWSLDEGSMVLRDIISGLDKDVASINVSEKGYATLDITARAEGGHSSLPPAQTAVGALAKAVANVQDTPMPGGLTDASKDFFDRLGPHFALTERILFANQWLFRPVLEYVLSGSAATNAMLRTTTAPTMLTGSNKENVLPQEATATVNFRLHPRDTIQDVVDHVTQAVNNPEIDITVRPGAGEASPVSRADNTAFALLDKTFRQVFGELIVVPGLTVAGTDSKHYSLIADDAYRINPFIFTAQDLPRFQGNNERVSVEAMGQAAQFYMMLLRNL